MLQHDHQRPLSTAHSGAARRHPLNAHQPTRNGPGRQANSDAARHNACRRWLPFGSSVWKGPHQQDS